jgi:hypothetical protein
MQANNLSWKLKDGRRVLPSQMSDTQLKQALTQGLREASRHFHEESLDCLASAAGGDDGTAYLAETQSETVLARALSRHELLRHMASVPRYAAVMREARGRVHQRRRFEQALARHIPG